MTSILRAVRPWLPLALGVAVLAGLCVAVLIVLPAGAPVLSAPVAATYTDPDPSTGVWPHYAETTAAATPAYASPRDVTIRKTGTAAVLATVRPPRPYQSFGFVAGTGVPDQWIAGAQRWHPVRFDNSAQPVTLFALVFHPASGRVTLTRLPAPPMRATEFIAGWSADTHGSQLAAATLSPDGRRLAVLVTATGGYQVRVYPVAGGGARTWTQPAAAGTGPANWTFSLTWLSDNRTLAVGTAAGGALRDAGGSSVRWLDTAARGGQLSAASKTTTLSFPAAKSPPTFGIRNPPHACTAAPQPASDGRTVFCPGTAAYPLNMAGAASVGIWVFSARSGKLTAAWDQHTICCALTSTDYPDIRWVSPHGDSLIAAGISLKNQGAQLFLRAPNGRLRRLPWQGLFHYPGVGNIEEPTIAWLPSPR